MSPVWLSKTRRVVSRRVRNIRWKTFYHQPPVEKKKKMEKEWEKQKGMPLICEGAQKGEGCLRADMSWHVHSFPIFCLLLINWEFLPFPSRSFFLSFCLCLSFSDSCPIFPPSLLSWCDSIAFPVCPLSLITVAFQPTLSASWWFVNTCLCMRVQACMRLHLLWYSEG